MDIGVVISHFVLLCYGFLALKYTASQQRRTTKNGHEPRKVTKMKKTNSKANKSNQKTPRLSEAEQEEKRKQKDAKQRELKLLAEQETDKVREALTALRKSDLKSAKNTYLAGKSLGNIKDGKLYRVQEGFKSFKAFVGDKFKISEQYAYMLINAAKVQDILFQAEVTSKHISEKLLRKLTFLLHSEDGSGKIVEIWKTATNGKSDKIPTDKALAEAVAASKPKKLTTDKSDSEILSDPGADAGTIIKLLRRVANGKTRLSEDDLSKLRDHLNTICDNAESDKNNK